MAQITLGRNAQSNIVVDAQYSTVSGNHATIFYDGGTYILQDHSTNGTYINGNRIHNTSSQIRLGDHITLGSQYILDMNEVVSLLGGGHATQRRVDASATQRYAPQVPAQPMNQQININVPNHSEQKNMSEQPAYLNKWNWGAFFFGWLWGVCNGVYWPLIVFIPYIGQLAALVICFILGANGSRYAWENFKGSATEFDAKQESWATAAGICFMITIVLGIIVGIVIAVNL